MSEDNVVKFDPNRKKPWLERASGTNWCNHKSVVVNDNSRVVCCSECDASLDPIQVLMSIANDERRLYHSYLDLKKIRNEIEDLKREEKLIKSRIRYAKKKGVKHCDVENECPINKRLVKENLYLLRKISRSPQDG